MKIPFGTKGIWKKPECETMPAKNMRAVVLEHCVDGTLYIFTEQPIEGKKDYLSNRTATIFAKDFIYK